MHWMLLSHLFFRLGLLWLIWCLKSHRKQISTINYSFHFVMFHYYSWLFSSIFHTYSWTSIAMWVETSVRFFTIIYKKGAQFLLKIRRKEAQQWWKIGVVKADKGPSRVLDEHKLKYDKMHLPVNLYVIAKHLLLSIGKRNVFIWTLEDDKKAFLGLFYCRDETYELIYYYFSMILCCTIILPSHSVHFFLIMFICLYGTSLGCIFSF